jgi:hypothetical protein
MAHVILNAHTVHTTVSVATEQLWTNLFANQRYLKNVGPWQGNTDMLNVYFQSDLQSVENVVSEFRRSFFGSSILNPHF